MESRYYYKDGSILNYYNHNKILHRTDGPAIEFADGSKRWWVESQLHRLDGPAVEWADGSKEWWVEGKYLTYEQFEDYRAELFERNVLSE